MLWFIKKNFFNGIIPFITLKPNPCTTLGGSNEHISHGTPSSSSGVLTLRIEPTTFRSQARFLYLPGQCCPLVAGFFTLGFKGVCVCVFVSDAGREYEGYKPLWFHQRTDPLTGETNHVYKGGYWESKDRQDWSMCPDIFWTGRRVTPLHTGWYTVLPREDTTQHNTTRPWQDGSLV